MKKNNIKKYLFIFVASGISLCMTKCAIVSYENKKSFSSIKVGDSRDAVINLFGKASHIDRPGFLFSRYASEQCKDPCAERLWFENRLSLDTEAWSVELDSNGVVIKKTYWQSP